MNISESRQNRRIIVSITALGISSICTQLVLLREFLNIFSGNELVLSVVLGNWFLLTAAGAWLGKFIRKTDRLPLILLVCQLIISILPAAEVLAVRQVRGLFFPAGVVLHLFQCWAISGIILLPYCLISGYLLTLFCVLYSDCESGGVGRVYFIDNIGDILGGILFSFVLILVFNNLQTVSIVSVLNILAAVYLLSGLRISLTGKAVSAGIIAAVLTGLIFCMLPQANMESLRPMFPGQKLLAVQETRWGRLAVTEMAGQTTVFSNGEAQMAEGNTIRREKIVHYPAAQCKKIRKILLLGGGVSGTISELLKYNPERIDYVELDPEVLSIRPDVFSLPDDPRIHFYRDDARRFVRYASPGYDLIISDLPDPVTAQCSRFYSVEFFRNVRKTLNPDGVFSFSIAGAENYISEELKQMTASLYHTLRQVFPHAAIFPDGDFFFAASRSGMTYDVSEKIAGKGVSVQYMTAAYLDGVLTAERIAQVRNAADSPSITNRDFHPVVFRFALRRWMKENPVSGKVIPVILIILILLYLIRLRPVSFSIFTTGITAGAMEFLILLTFQIAAGTLYYGLGILITLFMLGLAAGSYTTVKASMPRRKILFAEAGLLVLIMLFGIVLYAGTGFLQILLFGFFALGFGFLTGAQFPAAARVYQKRASTTAGTLYSADLLGSFIGITIYGSLFFPLLGVYGTLGVLCGIKVVSMIVFGLSIMHN